MAREPSPARRGFGGIERRDSGRYRAAYTGPDGRLYRAPTTFDAKEDAVAWLANRRAEIQIVSEVLKRGESLHPRELAAVV